MDNYVGNKPTADILMVLHERRLWTHAEYDFDTILDGIIKLGKEINALLVHLLENNIVLLQYKKLKGNE